ncbi:hypothetical protein UFOVP1288_55 [uncultured Caudovirales phage]|uniref:Uncharacterized protein n=1 Tax=uncultured Caudovirales phage TaxID=2100421 RepID=A0A6J5S844_9CAUD|nr:hypothetical protein UFOVP1195_55 [uncultured Caudovirales phage]CAB4196029.1 hypothetical protein UFOVP1288_55 [uncultured Caudovirales phage]CAB4205117.1 hypothetical protein UFOVP1409_55 [uncultured Caudovirales phage]
MAEHDDTNEYNKPMPVKKPVPAISGYPNKVANTQTTKIRGTGAATQGTGYNAKPS